MLYFSNIKNATINLRRNKNFMKAKIITMLTFCLLMLVSCNDKTSSSNIPSEEVTSTQVTSTPTSTSFPSSEPLEESSDEPLTSEASSNTPSSEQSTINEELQFISNSSRYGNTNGNTMNRSLAVYDFERKMHYYANRGSIYAYNPVTATSTELLADMSSITYLTLYENTIYFIGSTENYLYTYDLLSMNTDLVLERGVSYA